jgi:hypothetical protein
MREQTWAAFGAAAEFEFSPGSPVPAGLQFRPNAVRYGLLAYQAGRAALLLSLSASPQLQQFALALAHIQVSGLKPGP